MSLSECPKCWETPCACGHEYKDWSKERRLALAAVVLGVNKDDLMAVLSDEPVLAPANMAGNLYNGIGNEIFADVIDGLRKDSTVKQVSTDPNRLVFEFDDGSSIIFSGGFASVLSPKPN